MKLCMGCMNQIEDTITTCPHCGFNETTLRQESYYLDPGSIVGGKYIVGRVLNYSGHTISYLGMDAEMNHRVVVKEYLPSDFSTRSEGEKDITIYSGDAQEQFEQGLTKFLNEANRIQKLGRVDGIAQIYDCVAENDTGYVISEHVQGSTLKEILDSGKKFSVAEAKNFIIKILMGLSKVHPLDVIHCDISPETIIVTDGGEVKLLDFGETRYVTTANSKSLAIILKQGYAPEEQYRSRGVRGPWTDVYAVAAVMYRMITGVVPQESVERALVDELKEPSKMGVNIPDSVENALMNALNVYQNDRTSSADVFLKELTSNSVKRIKVKKNKNETGKFPVWAKCLVAVLLCAVIAGGVALVKMSNKDAKSIETTEVTLDKLIDKNLDDAQKVIDDINKANEGWNLQLECKEYVFDANPENHNKIYDQNVPVNLALTNKKEVEAVEGTPLTVDDAGNVSGTITCIVYSKDKVHYGEINTIKNAFILAKKLGLDTSDSNVFIKKKQEDTNYYDLANLILADGTKISAKDLMSEKNADKEINVEGLKIEFYASDFFYWKSLPDFVGKNVNQLPAYDVYEMKNETKRKATGEKKSIVGTSIVDDSFYTFSDKYKKGDIFKQTKSAGGELDASQGMDDALLYVIGQRISYKGETGLQVKAKINWTGVSVEWDGDKTQPVESVTVYNKEKKKVDTFKKGEKLTVMIKTKQKIVATQAPEQPQEEIERPNPNPPSNNEQLEGF